MCEEDESQHQTRKKLQRRVFVHFDKDLFHLKVMIQNGIGGLVTGHRCRGLPFMEDVTHASPQANCRAPEMLWRGFVHPIDV